MRLISTTVGDKEQAEKIAGILLKEKLAACINFFPCSSRYWWKNKLESNEEVLILVKTSDLLALEAAEKIKAFHPYQTPVIEVLKVEKVSPGVEQWINEVTKPK